MNKRGMIFSQYIIGLFCVGLGIFMVITSFGDRDAMIWAVIGSAIFFFGFQAFGPRKEFKDLMFMSELFVPVPKVWVTGTSLIGGISLFVMYMMSID